MTISRHFPRFRDSAFTGVTAPKYIRRRSKRRRPPIEIVSKDDKVFSNETAMGKWKADMTRLRRQYRQETSEIGESRIQERRTASRQAVANSPLNDLPSIESLSQYAWQDLSLEEKENVRLQKENNRKSHQLHANEERLRSLLDFYHSSKTYAVNSEQLDRKIDDDFKEHPFGSSKYFGDPLAAESIPATSMKEARLRLLADALGGFSSGGNVGEREVGELLQKISMTVAPDAEEPNNISLDANPEEPNVPVSESGNVKIMESEE